MQTCTACGADKPLSAFYDRTKRCKECVKERVRRNREAKVEMYRAYDRARSTMPHRMELRRKTTMQWAQANPDRRKAQVVLGNALRDGRIIAWPVCALPDCQGKPEAHHPHYGMPLDVVWLCPAHHKQAHAMARRIIKPQPQGQL